MSKNFLKIKNKYFRTAVLKSVLFGLCSGVFVSGMLLLILKLTGIRLNAGYYVLIGAVFAALCGGLVFYFLRPTEYFVAKQLDEGYGLNEKVKTMIACKAAEGDIITLQREDAEKKLENLPCKKPSLKNILICVTAAVVAVAILLTAVLVPAKYKDNDEFQYTNVQEISLRQLIEDVKKSNLAETPKNATATVLTDLANSLSDTQQSSVMRKNVVSAVLLISEILYTPNSFIKISAEMTASENSDVQRVSEAVIRGVQSYKDGGRISDLNKVEELAENVDFDAAALFSESLSSLKVEWEDLRGAALAQSLTTFSTALNDAVLKSETDESDGLNKILCLFAAELERISGRITAGGVSANTIQSEINSACTNYTVSFGAALGDQAYNCIMYDYVRAKLVEIFGLRDSDFPSDMPDNSYDPGGNQPGGSTEDNPDDPASNGGAISGDKEYGSNDTVYSPDLDAYVKYGDLLSAYGAEMLERIERGEATEEMAAFIIRYLEILYSGPDNSESAGN